MTRARSLSRLANSTVFTVSDTNRVGIGSTIPDVKLDVGGKAIIDDTTQTTSVSTGALVVSGGVGIGKSLFVGGDMSVAGTLTYEDVTNTETAGITTTGGLVVTGLGATFGSISTHFSNIEFGAAGVGGTITPLGHAEFVGVVTASSFSGDGSGLTGVASTDNINTSTLAQFTGGVGIADSIFHIGDDNTAIRFPSADTFTVETAGSERLRIIGVGGSIGINETTPDSKVDIVHSTAENSSTENLIHLRTDPSGSYVTRGLFVKIGRDGAYDNSAAHYDIVGSSGNSGFHAFEVQGDEKLRVTKDGGVLIGGHTTAVDSGNAPNIEIVNTSTSTLTLARNDTSIASGNDIAAIRVWGNDSNGTYQQCAEILAEADGDHGTGDKPTALAFKVTADGASSPTERLRITSAGQVIVNGTANLAHPNMDDIIVGDASGNRGITVASATNGFGTLAFGDSTDGSGNDRYQGFVEYYHDDNSMRLGTVAQERLRIASSGQIGLGGANYGTAGQVITSNGSGSAPTWQDASGGISTQAGTASGIVTSMFLNDATDHKVTATGICTITTTQSGTEGQSHTIRIVNSGIATVGFSTYFLFPSGSAPVLPTADGAVSLISFTVHDSVGAGCTQLLAGASLNFS